MSPGVVLVEMLDGQTRRVNLAGAVDLGLQQQAEHGERLQGVYLMPRSQRVIIHVYNPAESRRNPGRRVGNVYIEAANGQIADLVRMFGGDRLADLLPEFVDG